MSKPHLAGYSETFPVVSTGHFQKIWYEVELEPGDDPRQELYKCKKLVNDFYYESNKAAEKQAKEEPETPQTTEAKIIAQIYRATDLKVLESFKLLSSKYPTVKAAYEQQFEKLSK